MKIKADNHDAIHEQLKASFKSDKKVKVERSEGSTFVYKAGHRFEVIPQDGWAYVHSTHYSTNVTSDTEIEAAIDKLLKLENK